MNIFTHHETVHLHRSTRSRRLKEEEKELSRTLRAVESKEQRLRTQEQDLESGGVRTAKQHHRARNEKDEEVRDCGANENTPLNRGVEELENEDSSVALLDLTY